MGIQSATTLYPVNGTTVDTGTGIDVRFLSSSNGGTADVTQTCTATHTQDNVERTFDPATAGVTAANNCHSLQKLGWALRLTDDMTPTDDTNCNAWLKAGTVTVNMSMSLAWSGSPLSTSGPTGKASLWRYNPSTDTGTVIGTGSTAFDTWNGALENGVVKAVAISIAVSSAVEFAQGEVLMVQYGVNTGTLGNPLVGTVTYTFALQVDTSATSVVYGSGQTLATLCAFTGSASGSGIASGATSNVLGTVGTAPGSGVASGAMSARADMTGSATGSGAAAGAMSAVAGTTGTVAGSGVASGILAGIGSMTGSASGTGTATGVLGATGGMTGSSSGSGVAAGILGATGGMTGSASGSGVASGLASSVAGTTGSATGAATTTGLASIVLGTVGNVTIGAPSSETPDWPVTNPTRQVAGIVRHHETDALIEGATVRLYRDVDKVLITSATTTAGGAYAFTRDTDDPYTYFATANYDDAGTPIQGMTPTAAPTPI